MRIWYDVSGLYNWHGSFTGIQRVVYSLAEELNKSKEDAHYFIYTPGGFTEITYVDLKNRVEERRHEIVLPGVEERRITYAKIRHKSMSLLKDTIRDSKIEPQLRQTYKRLRKRYHSLKKRHVTPTPLTPFSNDDIVLVVDGNWQFGEYATFLKVAKSKISFKLVHVVHDLVAVKNPALANIGAEKIIGEYFDKVLPLTDRVIAISQSTKNDVEWLLNNRKLSPSPALSTVTLGDSIAVTRTDAGDSLANRIPSNFILAVSTIEVRKNYLSLYYAYKLAAQRNIDLPPLVIVGRKGWMAEETYTLLTTDPEISKKITLLQGLSDNELAWLYKNCKFTVFPSFYEGWGLPIAEALSYGKCCISSNTSSMPEVGGELVEYVSPYDVAGMMAAIQHLNEDDAYRRRLESKIKSQYKPRSWSDTFEQLLSTLRT